MCTPDDDMDGDFESAMTSAGIGMDESYGAGMHDWEDGYLDAAYEDRTHIED